MPEFQLTGALVRPWRWGDDASLVRHANNRRIWRNLRDVFPHPYTEADAHAWLGRATVEAPVLNFALEVEGEAAGGIGLRLGEGNESRSAEMGYWLGEAFWGRGIATEAVRAMTAYGFEEFGLVRIFAGVFEWNPASMRVLEKAGYELEGRLRKAVTKDGETIDQLVYAVVRDEE
jgi:RimJ/RimL family protein N-acetyltransferase